MKLDEELLGGMGRGFLGGHHIDWSSLLRLQIIVAVAAVVEAILGV